MIDVYCHNKFSWPCLDTVSEDNEEDIELPLFSFSTIATATGSFSNKNILGEGGFGPVYKVIKVSCS